MEAWLVPELQTEVLCCLVYADLCRYACCSRGTLESLRSLGFSRGGYQKAVSSQSLDAYRHHFMMRLLPSSIVEMLPLPFGSLRRTTCKLLVQALRVGHESDAADWLARTQGDAEKRVIHLYRRTTWDFWLYTVLSKALRRREHSPHDVRHVRIQSLPLVFKDHVPIPFFTILLTRLLLQAIRADRDLILSVCGRSDVAHYFPWTVTDHQLGVAELLKRESWAEDDLSMHTQTCFRSTTIALGTVLRDGLSCRVGTLYLGSYSFDDGPDSRDCRHFEAFLTSQRLCRVHLTDVTFSTGEDLVAMTEVLVNVPSLRTLFLKNVFSYTPTPRDIVDVMGHGSCRLSRLSVDRVTRRLDQDEFLLQPSLRTLSLRHILLCLTSMFPLCAQLTNTVTHVTSLDLSCNALASSSVILLAGVLSAPGCKIRRLNLSGNNMTHAQLHRFEGCFHTLTTLEMNDNFIGEAGTRTLLQMVGSVTLLSLNLNSIHMSLSSLEACLQSCKDRNSPLSELRLRNNYIASVPPDWHTRFGVTIIA